MDVYKNLRGRGSAQNHSSRFHQEDIVLDFNDFGWMDEEDLPKIRTEFFTDSSRSILARNDSPDIPFEFSVNPYRGCEHGCSYCYARPTHEYLGLSAGLDFESKIFVKRAAPELLRAQLMKKNWRSEPITFSGITDCYQPAERKFQLTKACLEVLWEFRNPAYIITKNHLICRDVDLLKSMAEENLVGVFISITTLNAELGRKLEPRTSTPEARFKAVEVLSRAGIPVGVNVAPIIPGLTDHEMPAILKASREAGARTAGCTLLRLPYSVKEVFTQWLDLHYPERKSKVLTAIQDIRDGKLNVSEFGARMKGTGARAENIHNAFRIFKKQFQLDNSLPSLNTDLFRRPGDQLSLFE